MAANWQEAGSINEVTEDQPLSAKFGELEVGVYRLGDQYYALEDVCPHAYALLSQGFVEDDEIECPLHGAKFHIPTGKCTKEPGGRDLKCFPIKIDGERIFVDVG